jgi:hypothetical protein
LIYAVQLSDVSYKEVQQTATSGAVTIDYSAGNYQAFPSITGSLSLGFSNWPASGTVGSLNLAFVVTNVAYTVTLPTAVSVGLPNVDGLAPATPGSSNVITFAAVGTYVYRLETADAGAIISIESTIRPTTKVTGSVNARSTTTIPAGGTAGAGYTLSSTANFGIFFGSGAPTLSAAQGSLYLRSDGSTTNNRMYVNTNGTTGWTAVTTAA